MSTTRLEGDPFGTIEVPADRLWGSQTQRSLEHFAISRERMPVGKTSFDDCPRLTPSLACTRRFWPHSPPGSSETRDPSS